MKTLSLLEHLQELLCLAELSLLLDLVLDLGLECLQLGQGLGGEVFWRRFILLDAFEVLYDVMSLQLLFVDDRFELVILFVDLLQDFFLEALLAHHAVLHVRARLNCLGTLRQNRLILRYLSRRCLLERHALAARSMILKVTIVAKRHVMCLTEDCKLLIVGTNLYLTFHLFVCGAVAIINMRSSFH